MEKAFGSLERVTVVKVNGHARKTDVHDGRANEWQMLGNCLADRFEKAGIRRTQATIAGRTRSGLFQVFRPTCSAMGSGSAHQPATSRLA